MSNGSSKGQYKDEPRISFIGARIREVRSSKKISIEKLANEYENDYSQINGMELGKVNFSVSNLYRIADALQVNVRDLLPPL